MGKADKHAQLYDVLKIRRHDEAGNLTAAGAEWREQNPRFQWYLLGLLLCVLALIPTPVFPVEIPVIAVLGAAFFAFRAFRHRYIDRAIIFEMNGRMACPAGIPHYPKLSAVHGHHGHVTSIEAEQNGCVSAFSRGGGSVLLALPLGRDHAREISVRLNDALREIRDAGAAVGGDLADMSGQKPLNRRKARFE